MGDDVEYAAVRAVLEQVHDVLTFQRLPLSRQEASFSDGVAYAAIGVQRALHVVIWLGVAAGLSIDVGLRIGLTIARDIFLRQLALTASLSRLSIASSDGKQ